MAGINIHQYLRNPTGKGSSFVAARYRIRQSLDQAFIRLLRRYRRQFSAAPYLDENGITGTKGNLIYWCKVPSETYDINRISYDVIILIEYDESLSLLDRNIKMFSNSPDFIFSYCFLFNKNDLLPDFIKSKIPTEALTIPPNIRNPQQIMGFQKQLYFALRYLQIGNCLTFSYIDKYKIMFNKLEEAKIIGGTADTSRLVYLYQTAKHMEAERKKTNRKTLSSKEKTDYQASVQKYKDYKKHTQQTAGKLFKHAIRSTITARKAEQRIFKAKKAVGLTKASGVKKPVKY